jgi:GT2 family glycosyltransferase
MSLIAMCCFDTIENKRSDYTRQTLESLYKTVNQERHRIIIIDNNSCKETKDLISSFYESNPLVTVITLSENVGTARGINLAIKMRKDGESVTKLDNDCVINYNGWADDLEEAIKRDPTIGICALKRVDLEEHPEHELDHYRSKLYMLPREKGQSWLIAEHVQHCMGTCTMFNPLLLDKVGFMWQKGLYALDDFEIAVRCNMLGFKNVFLPHIPIIHVDTGDTDYTHWKVKYAGEVWDSTLERINNYKNGTIPIYYDGGFSE